MTKRLIVSYLGLSLLILCILEIPLATLAQRFERGLATSQAERDANGLAAVVSTDDIDPSRRPDLRSVVAAYEVQTGGEVTVVGTNGAVLAASSDDADNDALGEWRSLTLKALSGQAVSAFVSDEGKPFAVATVPLLANGRSTVGAVLLGAPAGSTETRIHEIWLALGAFALGAMAVAALLGVVLARSMSGPLAHLESAVDRLGRGDLSARATETEGPDEIRSLARQFNYMAGRLDELVQAQGRFVADASHQLRSPLTALRLRIENLEAFAEGTSAQAVAAVGREIQRLSRIVDGLLTLGRAGQDQPPTTEVDVVAVTNERCEAWSALMGERGVALTREIPGRLRGTAFDLVPGDLDQILDNLLANSLEVSSPGGAVTVRVVADGRGLTVQVFDEGPGMPAQDLERAFDRFWQGTQSASGHSGLGLAIVRQLAQRNGIRVDLALREPRGLEAVITVTP